MEARKPNPSAGERLRALRKSLALSTRDVEEKSQRIAEERHNQEYHISHAWVTDIENGKFTPRIYKLQTLSAVYNRRFTELTSYYGVPVGELSRYRTSIGVPKRICWTAGPIWRARVYRCRRSLNRIFGWREQICLPESWRSGTRSLLGSYNILICANRYTAISGWRITHSSLSSGPVRSWRLTQIKERSAPRNGIRSLTVPSTSWNCEMVMFAVGVSWTGGS